MPRSPADTPRAEPMEAKGPLHWLVSDHLWSREHARGFAWLGVFALWCVFAAMMWVWSAGLIQNTYSDPVKRTDPNHVANLMPVMGFIFVAPAAIILTGIMLWQAEERRAKPPVEDERAARARRIAEMERELGISVDA